MFFCTSHITVHIADAISPFLTTTDLYYSSFAYPFALDLAHPPFPCTSTTFDRLFDLILLYSRFYFAWHYPEQTRTCTLSHAILYSYCIHLFPPFFCFLYIHSSLLHRTIHSPFHCIASQRSRIDCYPVNDYINDYDNDHVPSPSPEPIDSFHLHTTSPSIKTLCAPLVEFPERIRVEHPSTLYTYTLITL